MILLEQLSGLLENVDGILEHAEALLELSEDLLAHWALILENRQHIRTYKFILEHFRIY